MAKAKRQNSGNPTLPFGSGGALLRNVVENAAIPTFVANPDGTIVYANQAFAELLGYAPGELIGLGLKDLLHPDDAPAARAQSADLLAQRTDGYHAERRYLRKNGEVVWVLASAAALIDEESGGHETSHRTGYRHRQAETCRSRTGRKRKSLELGSAGGGPGRLGP